MLPSDLKSDDFRTHPPEARKLAVDSLPALVRFAPRQRQKPMNELLSTTQSQPELDVAGSLWDADMGAYYNLAQSTAFARGEKSCFLVWFEGHHSALAICPSIPRQTESESEADLAKRLSWLL